MTNPARIAALVLHVQDPEQLAQYYCGMLGMVLQDWGDDIALGYGGQGAVLILRQSSRDDAYVHHKSDRYWKIALTLPDLDHAHAQLVAAGQRVTTPHQFRDIAYMCHLSDPEGHVIELIQHTFEGARLTAPADPDQPLGGGVQLGLITLRSTDIAAEMTTCQHRHGMAYLSRQALSDLGFDLYFFGLTEEHPPDRDVNAIEIRPWLWQRPYTVLEFQHLLEGPTVTPAGAEPAEVILIDNAGRHRSLR